MSILSLFSTVFSLCASFFCALLDMRVHHAIPCAVFKTT
jgi:hypothetical protein